MKEKLRTFVFVNKYGKRFGPSFTTVYELRNYINQNVPINFQAQLLTKKNKYFEKRSKEAEVREPRLPTLVREFHSKNYLKNYDILYLYHNDYGVQALLENEAITIKCLDRRINSDNKQWLMLIPKKIALRYIRAIPELDKYIETTNEDIKVLGIVNFEKLPIKEKDAGLFQVDSIKSKESNIIWIEQPSSRKKSDKLGGTKNHKKTIQLLGNSGILGIGKDNMLLLGNPKYVKIGKLKNSKGKIIITASNETSFSKPIYDNRNSFSPNVKNLEKELDMKIELGQYYPVEWDEVNQGLIYDFNIKKEDN